MKVAENRPVPDRKASVSSSRATWCYTYDLEAELYKMANYEAVVLLWSVARPAQLG